MLHSGAEKWRLGIDPWGPVIADARDAFENLGFLRDRVGKRVAILVHAGDASSTASQHPVLSAGWFPSR